MQAPYGAAALRALGSAVAAAKAGDPMAAVTVIAPNNVAGIVARRHLAAGTGIAGIEITTLQRLAERIASPALAPRRPATRAVSAAAWRWALDADPGVFGDIAEHPATARALASAHEQLRDLSAAGLDAVRQATAIGRDLVRLHEQVSRRLAADCYDTTDVLSIAARQVAGGDVRLGSCVLYLPQLLTRAESALAAALAAATDMTIVAGLTGVRRADAAVVRSVSELGVTVGESPAPPTATRVLSASDSDDEVRCVVREVVAALRDTPAHRVAVLYAAAAPYARLLHEHLAAAGISVNGPGVRPVDERGIGRALLEVLGLAEHDLRRADLFQALANAPTRDFTSERIAISRWERVSRSAGVVAGDDWATRLDAYMRERVAEADNEAASTDPRQWLIDRLHRDAGVAGRLRDFACRLRDELRAASRLTTWHELALWCERLFTTLIGEPESLRSLPVEEQYAASVVVSVLRSLGALDAVGSTASLDGLYDVLAVELSGSLARVGRFGEGVFVAPVSAAVGLDLDVVYVCGMSEDLYPGRLAADALLPDRARRATGGELPALREHIDARHRHLLAALTAASREAVVSFARGDLRRSTRRLPSRFLLPSLRELSGDTALPATAWDERDTYGDRLVTASSFAGELLHTSLLGTEQEWRTRQAAALGRLDDQAVTAAVAMIRARASEDFTRFDGNLAGAPGLPDYAVDERPISPTALESYANCPHAFFVQRLLGVQQVEQPEDIVTISPADIGNVIHQSVEALVTRFADALPRSGQPWSGVQRDTFLDIVRANAADFERRGLTGHPRLWAGEQLRILDDARWLLDDDNRWRAEVNAAVAASELPFGMRGAPPVQIELARGRVLMRGSADKVDIGADGTIYVTDIKTGSQRTFKDITQDDPLVGATKLQLPVYAYAARARFGTDTSPVHATYWFVRRDRGRRGVYLTPELDETYRAALSVLVDSIARGHFPPRAPEAADFAWIQCEYCNPDGIGHADNRERWERKRFDPALHELVTLVEPGVLADGPRR